MGFNIFLLLRMFLHIGILLTPAARLVCLFIGTAIVSVNAFAELSFNEESIEAKINAIEAVGDGSEASKELIQDYVNIQNNLRTSKSNREKTEIYRQEIKENPQKTKNVYKLIKQKQRSSSMLILGVDIKSPVARVEQELIEAKASKKSSEALLAELENQKLNELQRPEDIALELAEANKHQQELSMELRNVSSDLIDSERNELKLSQRWLVESEAELARTKIEKLEQEMLSQQYRVELVDATRALTAFEFNYLDQRVQKLEELLGQLRQREALIAKGEVEEEARQAEGKHAVVQELTQNNAVTSGLLSAMVERLDEVTKDTTTTENTLKGINSNFLSLRNKIDIAGVTQAFGFVLLDQRRSLPDIDELSRRAKKREAELAEVGLLKFKHDEENRLLVNQDSYADQLLVDVPANEREQVSSELEQPISRRLTLLEKSRSVERALISELISQDLAERRLVNVVKSYRDFISTRLFWMRSAPPPSIDMLRAIPQEFVKLLSPTGWLDLIRQITNNAISLFVILGGVVFIFLIAIRKSLRESLQKTSSKITNIKSDQFSYTLQAFGIGLLLALHWPLLLYAVGYELSLMDDASNFVKSTAQAILWLSGALYVLMSVKVFVEPRGIADAHFKWPNDRLILIRTQLKKLLFIVLPLAFFVVVTSNSDVRTISESLSRLFVVSFLIVLPVCWYKVFLPEKGAFSHKAMKAKGVIFANLSYVWPLFFVGLPVVLSVAAFGGYVYTALTMLSLLLNTLLMLIILLCIYQFIARWLLIVQRRLRYEAALERREALKLAQQAKLEQTEGKDEPQPGTEGFFEIETPELDINAISQESRELLGAVLLIVGVVLTWIIWKDVFDSITFWSNVTLWEYVGAGDDGDFLVPVTLFDLLFSLFVVGVTLVSANKFPALMEMVVLQRFGINAGERYAAKTLVRYGIITVGMLWALSSIGASWGQIQWLAAAIGVGIGFGLQEIVANFISGIIILFERPIRVGDIVTVGDTDGVVTRIQIRATTIRNWDRKELLVPNKEFVTGRLLNWTLSDQTTRIIFPIGLAYGTDAAAAMTLITDVAKENEHVMEDPAPFVSFESLGDNSIVLYLRAYVASMDYRLMTISDLHCAVYKALNDNGYVISFPQRDLHIDTLSPLEIKLVHGSEAT